MFERIDKGVYRLVDISATASHSHKKEEDSPEAYKIVGSEVSAVVRPCALYIFDDLKYKHVSDFIEFQDDIFSSEKDFLEMNQLLDLIVNSRLPLVKEEVCFAEILNKIEKVEFSDEKKPSPQSVDRALLEKKLSELREQIEKIQNKIMENPMLGNLYEPLLGDMRSAAIEAEQHLNEAYSKIGYIETRRDAFEKTPKQSIKRYMYS